VYQDQRNEQVEVPGVVNLRNAEKRNDHQGLAQDDPALAAAKALQLHQVDERCPGPLEGPRQVERSDKGTYLRHIEALPAHVGGHGDRCEAQGNSLRNVQDSEGGQAAVTAAKEIPREHLVPPSTVRLAAKLRPPSGAEDIISQ
jgi:hypothetical protein